jgi:transposase-like protein
MASQRRKWSQEEKLFIIREVERCGLVQTMRQHQVAASTYYKWKEKYDLYGEEGLKQAYRQSDPELKRLQIENLRLKQLLADKELALQIKDELLKKTISRKRSS